MTTHKGWKNTLFEIQNETNTKQILSVNNFSN